MSDEGNAEIIENHDTNNVKPIKRIETIHTTGVQRKYLLQLCDSMRPKEKGKARLYQRAFVWATQGEWSGYDDWIEHGDRTAVVEIPDRLIEQTYQLDIDKKQSKAIRTIINDGIKEGGIPGVMLRKLDKLYQQLEGISLVDDED